MIFAQRTVAIHVQYGEMYDGISHGKLMYEIERDNPDGNFTVGFRSNIFT